MDDRCGRMEVEIISRERLPEVVEGEVGVRR